MVLFFFYFPIKVAGENPRSPALNDNPADVFLAIASLGGRELTKNGSRGVEADF